MFGIGALADELTSFAAGLDPAVLEPLDAQRLVEQFARIENVAAACKALCAKRVADSGVVAGSR
jgi:hypothetical protein